MRVKEVYTSDSGQLLMSKIMADGITWWEYLEYGQDIDQGGYGQVTLHANPSALASCSVGTLRITPTYNAGGLVRLYEYHDATTASASEPGGAKGYLRFEKVRAGGPGGAVSTLRELSYVGNAECLDSQGNSTAMAVFRVASAKEYLSPDNWIETRFGYKWHSCDNTKVLEQTTILPVVPESQNGPGGTTGARRIERSTSRAARCGSATNGAG